ncbi:MAG: hypothetical protein V3U51_04215 [Thermoplasmata archaeon]
MNSETMEYVSIEINRRPIYIIAVVMTVSGSVFMFFLTTSFGAELWEVLLFSIVLPSLLIVAAILGSLIGPIEIGAGPEGIQFVFKLGRRLDLGWKDVVSLEPIPNSDFYHLKYRRRGGGIGFYALNEKAANHVQRMGPDNIGQNLVQ